MSARSRSPFWFGDDDMAGRKIADYDFYSQDLKVKDNYLGSFKLAPGKHTLRFEGVGRNPLAKGNYLGLDSVRLRERWTKKGKLLATGARKFHPSHNGHLKGDWLRGLQPLFSYQYVRLSGMAFHALKRSRHSDLMTSLTIRTLLRPRAFSSSLEISSSWKPILLASDIIVPWTIVPIRAQWTALKHIGQGSVVE
jgi:hypothetical protein